MKFLAVCNHVGGLNALKPIIKEINSINSIIVLTNISNKKNFNNFNLPIIYVKSKISINDAIDFLKENKIKFLITATSEPEDKVVGRLESVFIYSSKKVGIRSITLIDSWQKYKERFSLNNSNLLEAIPYKICALDKKCKEDLIKNGFSKRNIIISGNPAWEKLNKIYEDINEIKIQDVYLNLNLFKSSKYIIFISQPISERDDYKLPYDEVSVLNSLINTIKKLNASEKNKFILFIKKHPSEKYKKFASIIKQNNGMVFFLKENTLSIYELSKFSVACVGMFSMLLKELEMIGTQVISYQPTSNNNQLIYTGLDQDSIKSEYQLFEKICNINKSTYESHLEVIPKATSIILKLIGEIM